MTEQRQSKEDETSRTAANERRARSGEEPTGPAWRLEGKPAGSNGPSPQLPGDSPSGLRWGRVFLALLGLLVLNYLIVGLLFGGTPVLTVPYTFFHNEVQAGNVTQITATGSAVQGTFKTAVTSSEANGQAPVQNQPTYTQFKTQLPSFGTSDLMPLLQSKGVRVTAQPTTTPFWETLLIWFGPALVLWGLLIWGARRAQSAGGGAGGMLGAFGKAKTHHYEASEQRTTFADVAGIDEAKEELGEVVDFLRDPAKYRRLGAHIPRGVLLSGAPGTGKTLLARAVAGEAHVPFFWLSASEFVEMFVGVGASRVRDLFTQAKASAPSIVFIDELDAIGRSRSAGGAMGGNDEREQTLNQILTEMDGFTGDEGVIVMAATNRPEVLDPALLRPGRFDRRITVNLPDQKGREAILHVHTRSVPLAADVDLSRVASDTPGMAGADLANLVNEAALAAARRGEQSVHAKDFGDALDRIVLGSERRIILSPLERERTAYHESGHALLGMLQPGADPVRKITIVPHGEALGVTFQSPTADQYGYGVSYLKGRITGAMGGRAAEELIYHETTTGPENDLQQATAIARQMVGRWGMSDTIGPVSVLPRDGQQTLGLDPSAPSDETRKLVDDEVRRILDDCSAKAGKVLADNRDKLDALAHALLERETLDEQEAYAIAGVAHPRIETAEQPMTAAAYEAAAS
jgi:cell division protease FtsH